MQHHHAHAAACLAEHGETGPALALVFDGTGYGPDGTLWGGELLRADLDGYERLAWLEPVPLPGGEAAVREPWRIAAVHLERAGLLVPWPEWQRVRASLAVNAPLASGMGRLFDAVAAVLGVRAADLATRARRRSSWSCSPATRRPSRGPGASARRRRSSRASRDELARGRPRNEIAAAFHETVAASSAAAVPCLRRRHRRPLGRHASRTGASRRRRGARLEAAGFRVLEHRLVPPNDGGISFGQAAVAARRLACA